MYLSHISILGSSMQHTVLN